jgi:histidinol-phosphate aminotransferase
MVDIPGYIAGQWPRAQPGVTPFKISSNENPYPPLASVLEVVARASSSINRYPDPMSAELVARIAEFVGVPADRVAVGTGSVGVLRQFVQALCGPGDEVVHAWRSFEAYPSTVRLSGAVPVQVPLTDGDRHDLPAMAAAVTDRTRLILICTPNNPTGTSVHADELDRFLADVPADVLVVIDEAYLEFDRDPLAVRSLAVHERWPNVALLRTFSKAYGLAGLRVGYAVAHPPVVEALHRTALPFGVSTVAQEAAIASLAAQAELLDRVEAVVLERHRVMAALLDQGWQVPASQANFVWLGLGSRTLEFGAACAYVGLAIRPCAGSGARCTIAEPEANDRLIETCGRFIGLGLGLGLGLAAAG